MKKRFTSISPLSISDLKCILISPYSFIFYKEIVRPTRLKISLLTKIFILIFANVPLHSEAQQKYSLGLAQFSSLLSQSTVLSVIRSNNGVLWIATLEGISRYDGSDLTDFRPYKSGPGFLESPNIVTLVQDQAGNIYAATRDGGLLAHDMHTNSFESYTCCEYENLPITEITAAFSDDAGWIWLGFTDGSVYSINPRLQAITNFENVSKAEIAAFTQDSEGRILAASSSGDVLHFDLNRMETVHIEIPGHCQSQFNDLKHMTAMDDFSIWIGTRNNGLHLVDLQRKECQKIVLPGANKSLADKLAIHSILYDAKTKTSLVATDQGLYIIKNEFDIKHFHVENSELADNAVVSISQGKNGIYWVGTFSGLNYLIPTQIDSYGVKSNPKLHSIVAIDSSQNHGLWIASYNGLMLYNPVKKEHQGLSKSSPQPNFTNKQIMSLNTDARGIWVGYRASGLEFYSAQNDQVISFNSGTIPKISSDSISAIITAESGETIVGTHGGGLNIISQNLTSNSLLLDGMKIVMLYEANDGTIWVGTESGLYRLKLSTKVIKEVSFDMPSGMASTSPVVWTMAESSNGNYWFGTMHHGLYMSDAQSESTNIIYLANSLLHKMNFANSIYAIQIDDADKIWCSTNQGLLRIDPKKNSILKISSHHGLNQTEFDFGVSHKDASGAIYFGGSDGYSRVDPKKVKELASSPSVILSKVLIAGRSILPAELTQTDDPIQLTHKNYFVTFTFSVLDFIDPEKNQFRYKLEGFDPEWIDNGTRNTATYTNLPPGNYVLRVQGANSSGIWNREGISLDIVVLPPPWLSWWAFCLYLLVLMIMVWMGKRAYDSYSIERRAVQLAKEKYDAESKADDDMQEQLEAQDEMVRSTYDHNVATLSLISDLIARQSDYIPDSESRDAMKGNIERISCLSLLESCLYFQNDGLLADLHKYTNLITSRLLENAPVRQESITTINEIPSQLIPAEIASPLSIVIFEVLENCIQHAFESESLANYIQLKIEKRPGDIPNQFGYKLTIRDNGIGMPESLKQNTEETSGLFVIHSITRQLGGTLLITSDNGTAVILDVPPSG